MNLEEILKKHTPEVYSYECGNCNDTHSDWSCACGWTAPEFEGVDKWIAHVIEAETAPHPKDES